ncbi:hypothetical protein CIG19_02045 [Enterobacterales bacterium CwR94]|nr:hypothetical protein CIG19_02045 [Enterobacterales bacterium CwR94]
MQQTLRRHLMLTVLPVMLIGAFAFSHSAHARTDRVIIENGSNALSNEQARQNKEQWDDTHRLRNKVNTRAEKDFDKADHAVDRRDACDQSLNVNAYWESNTLRCLDRRTGRPVAP